MVFQSGCLMGFSLSLSSFLSPRLPPLSLPLSSLLLLFLPLSFFLPQFELNLIRGFSPFTFIVIIDTISFWSIILFHVYFMFTLCICHSSVASDRNHLV